MMFKAGENIGPYQLLEQIGEGGMGTVFKAYHPALDRYAALKIIHPAFREDPNFVARFQREARLVAKLQHPNIVPIYDFAEYEKFSYLVMKFIEGSTLKDRLAQGPLSYYEVLQVLNSMGDALAYAHSQGILHRDIKPSNVLIGTDGVMYLVDFGLARVAQAEASTLSSASIMGTPHYVSPEQAMGKSELGQQTDIYSFGVMLYEIVVGQAPFSNKAGFAIIHDHIYTPPPFPRTLNPSVSEPVERVLLKALAKDPSDRFESIIQMVSTFNNAWLTTPHPVKNSSSALSRPVPVTLSDGHFVSRKSFSRQDKHVRWSYAFASIVVLISIVFSLIPTLRGNLISRLKVTKNTPIVLVESTATVQPTSNTLTPFPEVTPTNQPPSNAITTEPKPTKAPTRSGENAAPSPSVLEGIQTEVHKIDPTLPSLPSLP